MQFSIREIITKSQEEEVNRPSPRLMRTHLVPNSTSANFGNPQKIFT
jgi:hypothetical protein